MVLRRREAPSAAVSSDDFPLAATDASNFYFYQSFGEGLVGGICDGAGDEVKVFSYTPNLYSSLPNWIDYFYLGVCDAYPPQLMGATAGNGLFAGLFSENAYAQSGSVRFPGQNPYLFLVGADGSVLYDNALPNNDYSSSVATDGTNVYLALPQSDQVQAVWGSTGA